MKNILDSIKIIQYKYYKRTNKMEKKLDDLKEDIDLLSQIYNEMDETGKEKLKDVAGQVMKIWKTVNEEK